MYLKSKNIAEDLDFKSVGLEELCSLRLLRIQEVNALTTLSKSCINLWVTQNKFPKPITLSPTVKVWRASSIADWIDQQDRQGKNLEDRG